jgi:hypothetical protein
MSVGSAISTATRHFMDIGLAFGQPSSRYNARDDYRMQYDSDERYAAGVGVALGTAAPAAGLATWAGQGFRVPGSTAAGATRFPTVARIAGAGVLAGMTVAGGMKVRELVQDDGHLGSVGSVAGIVGGFGGTALAGRIPGVARARVAGVPLVPVLGLGAAVAGGIGGYWAGKQARVGDGNIGNPIANQTPTSDSLPGSARDFGRGVFNHFTEVGPTSQGVSFSTWGMRTAFDTDYSKAERAGGMMGDLGAAVILGGGALAATKRIANLVRGTNIPAGGLAERVGGAALLPNAVIDSVGEMPHLRAAIKPVSRGALAGGLLAVGALGAGLAYVNHRDASNHGSAAFGNAYTAGSVAAGGAAGVGIYRALGNAGVSRGPGALSAVATAAMLIGVLSAARMPVQQFVNDARSVRSVHGSGDLGSNVLFGTAGGAIGASSGYRIASRFAENATGRRKALILGAGALVGLGVGGAAGVAVSPLAPNITATGTGAVVGAGVGALAGWRLAGAKVLPMAAAGSAMGMVGSTLVGGNSN